MKWVVKYYLHLPSADVLFCSFCLVWGSCCYYGVCFVWVCCWVFLLSGLCQLVHNFQVFVLKGLFYTFSSLWWIYAKLLHNLLNWFPPSFGKMVDFSLREERALLTIYTALRCLALEFSPVALVKEHLKTYLGHLLDFFVVYFSAFCFCVWKKMNLIWI